MFELLIWLQEFTLARWTQSSGPLCLWQCFLIWFSKQPQAPLLLTWLLQPLLKRAAPGPARWVGGLCKCGFHFHFRFNFHFDFLLTLVYCHFFTLTFSRVVCVSCSQYTRAGLDLEMVFKECAVYNPETEYARWRYLWTIGFTLQTGINEKISGQSCAWS